MSFIYHPCPEIRELRTRSWSQEGAKTAPEEPGAVPESGVRAKSQS